MLCRSYFGKGLIPKAIVHSILVCEKYLKMSIFNFNVMAEKVKQGYKKLNFILQVCFQTYKMY